MARRTREQILKSRPQRRPEELVEASFHVWYEIETLKYCASRLPPHEEPDDQLFAVLMESFLIHARNLNHFFYGRDKYLEHRGTLDNRDVIVEDFFVNYEPWVKPPEYRISETDLSRINRQLAHNSYGRERSKRSSWDFDDFRARLTKMFERFVMAVPGLTLHPGILGNYPRPFHPPRE